jgi:cytochrome b
MTTATFPYTRWERLVHLGLVGFGLTAFLTGEFAEDGTASAGYLLHAYLGLSLAAFAALRMIQGVAGRRPMRFSTWSPLSRRQWRLALDDLRSLLRFRPAERGMHEGIAGLVQAFGLAVFAWMGLTGTAMFLLADGPAHGLLKAVEEVHEIGEALIPAYLALHGGAVLLHSLSGHPVWQRMFSARRAGAEGAADRAQITSA